MNQKLIESTTQDLGQAADTIKKLYAELDTQQKFFDKEL